MVSAWKSRAAAAPMAFAMIIVTSRASATLTPDPTDPAFLAAYNSCLTNFSTAGLDAVVVQLESSTNNFTVIPATSGANSVTKPQDPNAAEQGPPGTGAKVYWDYTSTASFGCGNPPVDRDPCASLYHELVHCADDDRGSEDMQTCHYLDGNNKDANTEVPTAEVEAVLGENAYRAAQTPPLPLRTCYSPTTNGAPLPSSVDQCFAPAPPNWFQQEGGSSGVVLCPSPALAMTSSGSGCAVVHGDPHFATFDGARYDFQAKGEFVLARSTTSSDLEVQGRQDMLFPGQRAVAMITAVAANVAGDKVGLYVGAAGVDVHVAGMTVDLSSGPMTLSHGGTVALSTDGTIEVTWPDGSDLIAHPILGWGLDVAMALPSARRGDVEGVLGNFNGDPADDISPSGGAPISQPPGFTSLYPTFADSWRVSDPGTGGFDSLFDYGPNESTATFTDKTLPDAPATASGLSPAAYAAAQAICTDAGVYDPVMLEACILDVAYSGQVVFALYAAQSQILTGTTLSIDKPGDTATLIFSASAGEGIFVDVPFSSFPDAKCPSLVLTDPQNVEVAGVSCVVGGKGYIERTPPLSSPGLYTLTLSSTTGGTGNVRLVVYSEHSDQRGAISINGPPVTAYINEPGAVARLSFAGTMGQTVSVDIPTSTLATNDCGPTALQLLDPNGNLLPPVGCLLVGTDVIGGTALPMTGQYTLLVDPDGPLTGQVTLKLHP